MKHVCKGMNLSVYGKKVTEDSYKTFPHRRLHGLQVIVSRRLGRLLYTMTGNGKVLHKWVVKCIQASIGEVHCYSAKKGFEE